MSKLDEQILKTQRRLTALREKRRSAQLKKKKSGRKPLKRGRPPLDESLLIRAVKMAETKPLHDVALSLGIARSTLYSKGLSRRALNGEIPYTGEKRKRAK